MAKRRASRRRHVKVAGAVLIALALLIATSVIPPQTGRVPQWIGGLLAGAVGRGLPMLPALCLVIGLIFFIRESYRLSARIYGILLAYLVTLVVLHLRYPAGSEFAPAHLRAGGGAVGALVASILRRWLGEPGLWMLTAIGALAAALLLSNRSLTEALVGAGRVWIQVGGRAAAGIRTFGAATGRAAVASAGILVAVSRRGLASLAARGAAVLSELSAVTFGKARPRPGAPEGVWAAPAAVPEAPSAAEGPMPAGDFSGTEPFGDDAPEPEELHRPSPAPAEPGSSGEAAATPAPAEDVTESGEPASPAAEARRRRPVVAQELLKFPADPRLPYTLPPLSLLDTYPNGGGKAGRADPQDVARSLERVLASFGVEARVVRWESGPVVTRFELQPAPGVKVQKITSLQNDIALALAASSVRLEAPIPGKAAVGVELPNERPGLVHLRDMLLSAELQQASSPLTVSVGKGIAGHPVVADLVAMPHLLIAGATGAGKSVALNSMIATLLFRATPEQVRFLMIDPKRVELTSYNGIPHLLSPVVTGPREAAAKLRWAIHEMESRYALFAADGVRNIQAFNAQHPDRPLAYIVIIIDELADLMMVAPKDFEEIICRLAQMTRAVGIHLVVATQRPSVDVITGLIKANITSRIAFAVSSQVDSRTILDHPGAEKLLGRGDMLFAPIGATRPMRVQGSYISDAESQRLVAFWRAQGGPEFVKELVSAGEAARPDEGESDDSLLADAARLVVAAGYGSVSLLQRKMRIGYVRAARLVDQLEDRGVVGPSQGSNPREVLVGLSDLDRILRSSPAPAAAWTAPGGRAAPAGAGRAARSKSARPDGGDEE